MADPVAPSNALLINPKVAAQTIAMILVHTVIITAKSHGWFDVTADEITLVGAFGFLAGYYTPLVQS